MTDTRFEIKQCLHRYEFWDERQKELFHSFILQFFKGEIDADIFYNNLKMNGLITSTSRGPTDYIGSDDYLKKFLKDYIIDNNISALIQYAEKHQIPKE